MQTCFGFKLMCLKKLTAVLPQILYAIAQFLLRTLILGFILS